MVLCQPEGYCKADVQDAKCPHSIDLGEIQKCFSRFYIFQFELVLLSTSVEPQMIPTASKRKEEDRPFLLFEEELSVVQIVRSLSEFYMLNYQLFFVSESS